MRRTVFVMVGVLTLVTLVLMHPVGDAGVRAQARPNAAPSSSKQPITLIDQGSFLVGGTVVTNPGTFDPVTATPDGQTIHGDHAYVQYQIPPNARTLPIVMFPGGGAYQTWESTPDGRDGFRNIFIRRGFSTYVFDQPRRGRAGRSVKGVTITPVPGPGSTGEQGMFVRFRVGIWPDYFPGVQFPRDQASLEQWWRQQTPATGPGGIAATDKESQDVVTSAAAALFARTGPAIMITHSASGILGWLTRMKTDNIKAIYSYEDTNFVFPEGEVPPPMPSAGETVTGEPVSAADFAKLTTIPIMIVYGDNIPTSPSKYPGLDLFRVRRAMCQKMVDTINAHGGHAEILDLPKIGIRGNTHFPMSDLNNVQIADLLSRWLNEKGLDRRGAQRGSN